MSIFKLDDKSMGKLQNLLNESQSEWDEENDLTRSITSKADSEILITQRKLTDKGNQVTLRSPYLSPEEDFHSISTIEIDKVPTARDPSTKALVRMDSYEK